MEGFLFLKKSVFVMNCITEKEEEFRKGVKILNVDSFENKEAQIEIEPKDNDSISTKKIKEKEYNKWLTPFGAYIMNAHFKLSKLSKDEFNRSDFLTKLRSKIKSHKYPK